MNCSSFVAIADAVAAAVAAHYVAVSTDAAVVVVVVVAVAVGDLTFWKPRLLSALGLMLDAHAPSHLFTAMFSSHERTSTEFLSYSSGRDGREQTVA